MADDPPDRQVVSPSKMWDSHYRLPLVAMLYLRTKQLMDGGRLTEVAPHDLLSPLICCGPGAALDQAALR